MAKNREKLETTAQEIVQRRGMSGLSFRTLAADVGIKSSSVHYHFPEKSDLGSALIQRYSDDFFAQLQVITESSVSLKEKLKRFIDIFAQVGEQQKLCLCGMMAAEFELLGDENKKLILTFFELIEKWLVKLLESHQQEHTVTQNRKALARVIISSLEGALLLDRMQESSRHITAQRTVINRLVFN